MSQDRVKAEPLQLRSLYKYYKLMDRGCSATRINKKNYSSDYRHIIKDKWHFLVNLTVLIMQATKVNKLVFVLNVFKKIQKSNACFLPCMKWCSQHNNLVPLCIFVIHMIIHFFRYFFSKSMNTRTLL